jgi:heme A synthase
MKVHYLAWMTVSVTLLLLMLGSVVWGTGSSLACPDWPTCYGTFVPKMTGGVLYEHSHRLLGALVGLFTIALSVWVNRSTDNRRLRRAGYAAVGLVALQGALGGLTVLLKLPPAVSIAHLACAMLLFCLLLWVAWQSGFSTTAEPAPVKNRQLRRLATAMTAAIFVQVIMGGLVRHTGGAAACLDLPLCQGALWPSEQPVAAKIHMLHRLVGVAVGIGIVAFAVVCAWHPYRTGLPPVTRRLAALLVPLLLLQIGLGVLNITSGLDVISVTAHMGVAALLLGAAFLLVLSFTRPSLAEARANQAGAWISSSSAPSKS